MIRRRTVNFEIKKHTARQYILKTKGFLRKKKEAILGNTSVKIFENLLSKRINQYYVPTFLPGYGVHIFKKAFILGYIFQKGYNLVLGDIFYQLELIVLERLRGYISSSLVTEKMDFKTSGLFRVSKNIVL